MSQPIPDRLSLKQVIRLVDKLSSLEREELRRRLDFQSWDEQWNRLKSELTEQRAAQGLPPPTDEDIHAEIDAQRSPEELAALKREVQKGIDSLNRGEGVPAEQVLKTLRARSEERLKNWKTPK
jgi:hypothetical protein